MLVGFGPYVCIWLVARDLIAVAPNWSTATGIAVYGWWALGLAAASIVLYFIGLTRTHLSAFRRAANMRKQTAEHLMSASLGYFDTHASGALRRVVDGCAAETESLLFHKLPDTAGSVAMPHSDRGGSTPNMDLKNWSKSSLLEAIAHRPSQPGRRTIHSQLQSAYRIATMSTEAGSVDMTKEGRRSP